MIKFKKIFRIRVTKMSEVKDMVEYINEHADIKLYNMKPSFVLPGDDTNSSVLLCCIGAKDTIEAVKKTFNLTEVKLNRITTLI